MRSKFGTVNQSNFGFKNIDRLSSRCRIPPFLGDFFEALTSNIMNAKIISTGAGIKGRRADLQKGKYLIEVKACREGERFKLTREQYEVFKDVNNKLKDHGGVLFYFMYNYKFDWKDFIGSEIDDVISLLARKIVRLIVCDIDTIPIEAVKKDTKCIYLRHSDFDSSQARPFLVSERNIYGIYFSAFSGMFIESDLFSIEQFENLRGLGYQSSSCINPTTGEHEDCPF